MAQAFILKPEVETPITFTTVFPVIITEMTAPPVLVPGFFVFLFRYRLQHPPAPVSALQLRHPPMGKVVLLLPALARAATPALRLAQLL
jgi:hypothetical protein